MKLEDVITIKALCLPLNRRGMFSYWSASIGDAIYHASRKEQAIEGVVEIVKAAMTGDSTPEVLFSRSHYAIVYRQMDAWGYRIAPIGDESWHGSTVGYETKQEATQHARGHLNDISEQADKAVETYTNPDIPLPYTIYLNGNLWARLISLHGIYLEHIPAPDAYLNRVEVYYKGQRERRLLVTAQKIVEELPLEEE